MASLRRYWYVCPAFYGLSLAEMFYVESTGRFVVLAIVNLLAVIGWVASEAFRV